MGPSLTPLAPPVTVLAPPAPTTVTLAPPRAPTLTLTPPVPGVAALAPPAGSVTTLAPPGPTLVALAPPPLPDLSTPTVAFTGSGQLSAVVAIGQLAAAARLAGAGTLTATAVPVVPVHAALGGEGTLSAVVTARIEETAVVALGGEGTLSAVVAVVPEEFTTAALDGDGALSATTQQVYSHAAALAGLGLLSAQAVQQFTAPAALSGSGALSAAALARYQSIVNLGGTGTLSATVAPAAVQIVGANFADLSSGSGTVPIPAHQAGDLIVIYAFTNQNSTNPPTPPAAGGTVPTWHAIDNPTGGSNCASATYNAVAAGTTDTSGTWSTDGWTLGLVAVVLRGWNSVGAHAEAGGSATPPRPSCPAITPQVTDGTSALLQFYGLCNTAGAGSITWGAPPTGYTALTTGSWMTYASSKNATSSDGAAQMTNSLTGTLAYRGAQLELRAH